MSDLIDPVRIVPLDRPDASSLEWLVTNGLGGYASGTIGGAALRRYHGLLVAALPNPLGRTMIFNQLSESVRLPDRRRLDLGWSPPAFTSNAQLPLVDFRLELGLPVWRYEGEGVAIERRLAMPYGFNTTIVVYRLLRGAGARLELRPAVHVRGHDEHVSTTMPEMYPIRAERDRIELCTPDPIPSLRFHLHGDRGTFVVEHGVAEELQYTIEASRGYDSRGKLYSPGRFRASLAPDRPVALCASTEPWDTMLSLTPDEVFEADRERRRRLLHAAVPRARTGPAAELVLAADQFVFRPIGRAHDRIRARVAGDEAESIIAGYHWFTDWGRDTMISLEGLTLVTGRVAEAGSILRTFAHYVRDGLVPNLFPEGASEGLYHTADATMWFFHALDRYLRVSGDELTLAQLLPTLRSIIDCHVHGTRFGIGVDPADGLLRQGAPGYQLTWMDAKCGDWVVTPRRGKAVEINALWYNALRSMEQWLARTGDAAGASSMRGMADRAQASFDKRFWNPQTAQLFDVVDGEHGDDPSSRPNQIFALSLSNPVLDPARWPAVLAAVERALVTPLGLRSLAPDDPQFKPTYHGDLQTRDAAYHQGTVWSWLMGAYIDARLRVHPDDAAGARRALDGLVAHLGDACIGQVSEVFDALPPYRPGGCIAQAWGVAELLRSLVSTAG